MAVRHIKLKPGASTISSRLAESLVVPMPGDDTVSWRKLAPERIIPAHVIEQPCESGPEVGPLQRWMISIGYSGLENPPEKGFHHAQAAPNDGLDLWRSEGISFVS